LPQELNKEGSLRSGSCEKMHGHNAEKRSMNTGRMEEVYHKAVEEGLKFSHMHKSNQ